MTLGNLELGVAQLIPLQLWHCNAPPLCRLAFWPVLTAADCNPTELVAWQLLTPPAKMAIAVCLLPTHLIW